MKNTGYIVTAVVILAGMFWFFGTRPVKPYVVPEGMVLVSNTFIDSLQAVANKPPDTTVVETIVVEEKIVTIVRDNPAPAHIDPVTNQHTYIDSVKMIDDGINAWVRITSQDIIDQITWGYKPVYKTITKEITIPKPYPVKVYVDQPQRGLYISGGIGAGINTAGFSLGLTWQQRNGFMYGAEMMQFDSRFYMAKIGYKIL